MKSTKTDKPSDVVYPCLMEGPKGKVVLFSREGEGVVVFVGSGDIFLGHHLSAWAMSQFTPYTGKVTLENGE